MTWRQWLYMTALAGAVLLPGLTGCQSVSGTGRSQLMLITEDQEKSMGESAWKEIKKQEKVSADARQNALLSRIGKNLSAVVNRSDYRWEFVVFANNTPNAFCLPGGKVGVYAGLFPYTANEAELATVVGHEIAHATSRHGGERVSQGIVQQVGAEVLGATVSDSRIQQAYGITTNLGAILPYSRKHEYEADYVGLKYMAMAGYDPRAALSFWEKFGKLDKSSRLEEFLSTHPMSESRLEELRKAMPEALRLYQAAPVKRGLGEVYSAAAPAGTSAPAAANVKTAAGPAPAKGGITALTPAGQPSIPAGTPAAASAVKTDRLLAATRNDLSFSISYPSGWEEKASGMSTVFTAPSREEIICVQGVNSAENGGSYIGVSDLVESMYRQIAKSSSSSRVYRNEPSELHSRVGQEFYVDIHKNERQYRQWFAVFPRLDGRMFYVYSYTAMATQFSDGMPSAKRILQTFQFLNDSAANAKPRVASPVPAATGTVKKKSAAAKKKNSGF